MDKLQLLSLLVLFLSCTGAAVGVSRSKFSLYPPIEPYFTGFLKVSAIHTLYYEQCGNPEGKPVVVLHGGPGFGSSPITRQFFDPKVYRIIQFDQRGAGNSTPAGSIEENTTWDLVEDMEKLRIMLGIDTWLVFGGSWGSTLALAYAETHPTRVKGLIIRGIFLARRSEVLWMYQEGASHVFPDQFEKYIAPIPEAEQFDLINAFNRRLNNYNDKETMLQAAVAWANWESSILRLIPNNNEEADESLLFAEYPRLKASDDVVIGASRIENHYMVNAAFFKTDGQLLQNAAPLNRMNITIIQGRYDMVCPFVSAYDLHKVIPKAEFVIVKDAGHSIMEPGTTAALLAATEKYKSL